MADALSAVHNKFLAELKARDLAASQRMFGIWEKAWLHIQIAVADLNTKIAKAQAKGEYSPAWAYQKDRLADIDATVTKEIDKLSNAAQGIITANQANAIEQGQQFAEQSAVTQLGGAAAMAKVGVSWGRLNPAAVEHIAGYLADGSPLNTLLAQLPAQAAAAIHTALVDGIVQARNPRVTARIIRQQAAVPLIRAERIARTETFRAYRTASLESMKANSDIVQGWMWLCSFSKRTCPVCLGMNGSKHQLSEPFASHVSCFTAGTMVAATRIDRATTRWFDGEVIDVETVLGNRFTVTKNHPILTPQGWIAAGLLNEGSDILSCLDGNRVVSSINPHDDNVPTAIEDVASSLRDHRSGVTGSVPSAAEHFHGDGIGGKVNIVTANSLLRDSANAAIHQPLTQEQLVGRDMSLVGFAALGASDAALLRHDEALHSFMRGLGDSHVHFRCPTCSYKPVSGSAVSDFDTSVDQSGTDRGSANIKALSKCILGVAGSVSGNDFGVGQCEFTEFSNSRFGGRNRVSIGVASKQSAFFQDLPESFMGGVEEASHLLTSNPGNVSVDRVFKVNIRQFSGHVYNLQTSTGWYIANNIIAHNCRCVAVPITTTWKDLLGDDGSDIESTTVNVGTQSAWNYYAKQDEATQNFMVGPGKRELLRVLHDDHGIANPLRLLVGWRNDPKWGPERYERSLKSLNEIMDSGKLPREIGIEGQPTR